MSVFDDLRAIFVSVGDHLRITRDEPGNFAVDSKWSYAGKSAYFGGVKSRKRYTAFYLMPVYVYGDLLEVISDRLRARMHGQACFNFIESDEASFEELSALVKASLRRIEHER